MPTASTPIRRQSPADRHLRLIPTLPRTLEKIGVRTAASARRDSPALRHSGRWRGCRAGVQSVIDKVIAIYRQSRCRAQQAGYRNPAVGRGRVERRAGEGTRWSTTSVASMPPSPTPPGAPSWARRTTIGCATSKNGDAVRALVHRFHQSPLAAPDRPFQFRPRLVRARSVGAGDAAAERDLRFLRAPCAWSRFAGEDIGLLLRDF